MSDRELTAVEALIQSHGAPALAVGTFLEGPIVATLGGLAVHQGLIPGLVAFAAIFVGGFVYDQLVFALARNRLALPLAERMRRTPGFDRATQLVAQRPTAFVLGYRLLPGMSTAGAAAVSAAGVSHPRFVLLNAVAVGLFTAVFATLGYFFGNAAEAAFGELGRWEHRAMLALGVVAVMLVAGFLLRRWWRS